MSIEQAWYKGSVWLHLLRPLSALFRLISAYIKKRDQDHAVPGPIPVVVVGNISVGGTGKTPLLIALVRLLREQGYKPGVISRGYGSKSQVFPYSVKADDPAQIAGDEPLLIAQACNCPVVIAPQRTQALALLARQFDCDIALSDDGLQHYKLHRDVEIAVVDGQRGLGNGYCLPAGPLREQPQRLQTVDWVVVNQPKDEVFAQIEHISANQSPVSKMTMVAKQWRNVADGRTSAIDELLPSLAGKTCHAIAAIGNPQRFFDSLQALGIQSQNRAFADHHQYQDSDLHYAHGQIVFMTAKDAVKCSQYRGRPEAEQWWVLDVEASLDDDFAHSFIQLLKAPSQG